MSEVASAAPPPPLLRVIEYVHWDQLRPSPLNPRRPLGEGEPWPESMFELKASIHRWGIIHSLLARPAPRPELFETNFEIVCGNRRWEAVKALVEEGLWAPDVTIPVCIKKMDDRELVQHALAENIDRADLTPLEEGGGFAWLTDQARLSVETIAAEVDRSPRYVYRRLAFHHRLSDEVKGALTAGLITLSQAEAFTVGEQSAQDQLLVQLLAHPGRHYPPAEIRRVLLERTISLSHARFPIADYKGERRADFFTDADAWHACDLGEFRRLQLAWCEAERDELAKTWAWAELQIGGWFDRWEFDQDKAPSEGGGALLILGDDLRVDIKLGLVRRRPELPQLVPAARRAPDDRAALDARHRAGLTREHLEWARTERVRRLQLAIAAHPGAAMALIILDMLLGEVGDGNFANGQPAINNPVLDERIAAHRAELGAGGGLWHAAEVFPRLIAGPAEGPRSRLMAALVASQCGGWQAGPAELGDSALAIVVARALGVTRPAGFTLDAGYLERLSRAELLRVAAQCGAHGLTERRGGKDDMIGEILLSPLRDPCWVPPELCFGEKAAIEAALTGMLPAGEPARGAAA